MLVSPHLRVTFSGHFGTAMPAPERWSFGLSFDHAGNLTQAQNDALFAAGVNLMSDADAHISVNAFLDTVKSAHVGANGKYDVNAPVITMGNQAGASGANSVAPQCALAVSLRTGNRNVHGRYYAPMPSVTLAGDSLTIVPAQVDAILAAHKTFLRACAAAVTPRGATPSLVVSSTRAPQVVGDAASAGADWDRLYPVTEIRVGAAVDTIRSRRRSLKEAWHAAVFP